MKEHSIMHPLVCTAAILVALLAPRVSAQASAQVVRIDGAPTCARCTIVLDKVASIGRLQDDISFDNLVQVARDSRGHFFLAPLMDAGQLAEYDSIGRFIRKLGVFGDGPGEFRRITMFTVGNRDTLLVYDGSNAVVGRFAPGAERPVTSPMRAATDFHRALLGDGGLLSWGATRLPERVLAVMHYGPDGSLRTSFAEISISGSTPSTPRFIAERNGQFVWVANQRSYTLTRWSLAGIRDVALERKVDFFAQPPEPAGRRRDARDAAAGFIAGNFDTQNRLWLFFDAPQPRVIEDSARLEGFPGVAHMRDGFIEVVDIARRQVYAAQRFDTHIYPVRNSDLVFSLRQNADGLFIADIWRPSIVQR